MEASGAVRYRRGMMRAVTPTAIAEQLAEVRRAATAFGVGAVAEALERAAREALAVARTEEEAELALNSSVSRGRRKSGAVSADS